MTEGGEGEEESRGQVGDGEEKPGSQKQEELQPCSLESRSQTQNFEEKKKVTKRYVADEGAILKPTRTIK